MKITRHPDLKLGRFFTPYGMLQAIKSCYLNGSVAIVLEMEKGEPFTDLSVDLPEPLAPLESGEFFVQTWFPNERIIAAALASGLFEDTGRRSRCPHAAPIWKIRRAAESKAADKRIVH